MPSYPTTFYWRRSGAGRLHWHFLCDEVPVRVQEHPRWATSTTPPPGRASCPHCQRRDEEIIVV